MPNNRKHINYIDLGRSTKLFNQVGSPISVLWPLTTFLTSENFLKYLISSIDSRYSITLLTNSEEIDNNKGKIHTLKTNFPQKQAYTERLGNHLWVHCELWLLPKRSPGWCICCGAWTFSVLSLQPLHVLME